MLPTLINTLTWWQWLILAMVPPAIVLLYFLKLKRRPLEVPSTYLWHRSIEDLHVNTIWQRLRRNLLLFLQLLILLLAILALLRPGWRGEKLLGHRFVLLIDNSASMSATDVPPSRLDEAKRQATEVIDQMESGDVAMIVSFADTARVEQMFTDNRGQLRRAVEAIRPTPRPTAILEALKVAAGLANPGRSGYDISDVQVAEPMPATLFIFSDGRFDEVQGFSLGNLEPVYRKIGKPEAVNVGIVAFSVGQNELRPEQLQAFARLENFGRQDANVSVDLYLNEVLSNADRLKVPAGQGRGVAFPLSRVESGVLHLKIAADDDLIVDDEAWAPVNPPRRAKVLMVSPDNEPLRYALQGGPAQELAEVTIATPDFLRKPEYQAQAASRAYDLVIYDRCQPDQMPQANTLFVAAVPPEPKLGETERQENETTETKEENSEDEEEDTKEKKAKEAKWWKAGPVVYVPGIIDTDFAHPLMQWLDLSNVQIADGTPLEVPPGGTVLIDTDAGPMFAVAPREGFEDAVLGFQLAIYRRQDKDGAYQGLIGWPIRASFPGFVLNVLQYLGTQHDAAAGGSVRPGRPVTLDAFGPGQKMTVRMPSGNRVELPQNKAGKIGFTQTTELGVYDVLLGEKTVRRFAVNLFQPSESDIPPKESIQLGWVKVEGKSAWEAVRREMWKLLLLAGLAVLLVEWYIYNRRVYL
jgi:hypothetical protein